MYVGITRAQRSLAVSWTKKRKQGPRDGALRAEPLHRRDGPGQGHHQGRPARKAQGAARGVRAQGPGQCRIDESLDGRSINGVWSGTLQPDSCGREFRGIWRNAADDSTHPFILKKTERTADQ
jgi:hypothetical protein